MNTLKTVYSKLFKEETQLASHEVELGLLDELNSLNNQGEALRQGVNKFYSINNQLIAYAKEERSKFAKYLTASEKLIQTSQNKAKELGIDINDSPAYKNAKSRIAEINNVDKIYMDFLNKA